LQDSFRHTAGYFAADLGRSRERPRGGKGSVKISQATALAGANLDFTVRLNLEIHFVSWLQVEPAA
jgi:hypothetical protein